MQIFRTRFLLVALAIWTAVCETQRLEANLYRVSNFPSLLARASLSVSLLSSCPFIFYFWESSNSGN